MTAAELFDATAAGYDDNPHHDRIAQRLVSGLAVERPGLVVDVATGTGVAAFAALSQLEAARVVAVDVSAGMLERARAKAAALDPDGRIEWRQAPAVPLALPDGVADVVLCASSLHFLTPDAVTEWARVLRPGGTAAFSIPHAGDFSPSPGVRAQLVGTVTPPSDADEAAAIADTAGFEAVRVELTDRPRGAFLVWARSGGNLPPGGVSPALA